MTSIVGYAGTFLFGESGTQVHREKAFPFGESGTQVPREDIFKLYGKKCSHSAE